MKPKFAQVAVVSTMLLGLTNGAIAQEAPNVESAQMSYEKNSIPIIPKADKSGSVARDLSTLHSELRTTVRKVFPRLNNLQSIQLPPGADVQQMMWLYVQSGLVDLAEPNYIYRLRQDPNDPLVQNPALIQVKENPSEVHTSDTFGYHLFNRSSRDIHRYLNGSVINSYPSLSSATIHADLAWNNLHSSPNVIVAVIDDGIRYTHEDLSANIWCNLNDPPGGGDQDNNGYVDDYHGICPKYHSGDVSAAGSHGTFIAGVLGARGNNNIGVCGVTWEVQMMPLKAFLDELTACDQII